jgi:RNA polymerase sigma factor (sigma-70 family)
VVGVQAATDAELLAACLRGEAAGWEGLLDRYAALIYSIARKYGLSDADSADVFQSVCVTLLERLDSVRSPGALAAWLITTTSRECLALLRRHRRDDARGLSESSQSGDSIVESITELPEQELLALERQREVRAAVAQLSPNCRRLVEGLFTDALQQQTYQQLAAGLGIPMNSLGPTRARCLERLRRLLLAAGYVP